MFTADHHSKFSPKQVMSSNLEAYQFGSFLPQTYNVYPNEVPFHLNNAFGNKMTMHQGPNREFKPKCVPMSDSCVLKLKGLPYSTTEEEIYDFFREYDVKKVAFVLESDGRPSGLAFAEFDSTEEALRALQKNGDYIGERYVKLLHVPKQEMEDQVKFGTAAIPKSPKPRLLNMAIPTASLYGLPNFPPQTFMSNRSVGINHPISGDITDSTAVAQGFHLFSGTGWGLTTHPAITGAGAMSTLSLQNQQMCLRAPIYPTTSGPLAHIRHFNNDGSTIRIRGLPFKVTEQEIMEFFQGFRFIPNSVQIDKDSSGRSSGEGWITFINSEEAKRAVRERNRQYLQSRYLELSILQIPH